MITRAEIVDIKSLATKQGREELGAFIAEGEKLVGEIRNSSLRIRRILQTKPIFADGEIISEFALLHVALVTTPADVNGIFRKNTLFKGFGQEKEDEEMKLKLLV